MNKPTLAYMISLVAGVIGIVFGIISLLPGISYTTGGDPQYYSAGNAFLYCGLLLFICSAIVVFAARKLNSNPTGHIKWGVTILIFSVVILGPFYVLITLGLPHLMSSILGIGSLLGSIGGILALLFKPEMVPPQQPTTWTQPPPNYQQPTYPPPPPPPQYQQPQSPEQKDYPPPPPPQAKAKSRRQETQTPSKIPKFCSFCGTSLGERSEKSKFCPNCGEKIA